VGGLMICLRDFECPELGTMDLELRLVIGLELATEEVVFRVIPHEKRVSIFECRWPKMVEPGCADVTVVPNMQGVLIPRDFPRQVVQYDDRMYGRGFYMPWWGYQQGSAAAMMILETPVDAAAKVEHPAGGPTRVILKWRDELGRMGYMRTARFCAFNEGNYVTLAKRYRRYVIESGNFVSLKEKIARNPKVSHLLGSPVIHTSILYHMQPSSSYYDKNDPSKNHMLVKFDDRIADLRKLSAKGLKKAYLHLDGWGYRGYDNLHPDHMPPCEEAGGWEEMKRFGEACEELNFLFAIHDQYHDYFHDGPAHDARHDGVAGGEDGRWGSVRRSSSMVATLPHVLRGVPRRISASSTGSPAASSAARWPSQRAWLLLWRTSPPMKPMRVWPRPIRCCVAA
jgi:hypothetical protein